MVEPFGIAASAIGIAAAFTACVDCFGYIQFGRHFGRDFQTDQLTLSHARLRLTRWGEAVKIYDDPKLSRFNASETDVQLTKDTLLQILTLFASSESISKKHKIVAKADEDLSTFTTADMDPLSIAKNNKMRALAVRRQKGSRFLQLTSWALYRRSEFKDLLGQIVSLINNIEKLFPAPEAQSRLLLEEAVEIGDKQSIELIENTTERVDTSLKTAAQTIRPGHQYSNVTIEGQAQTGDAYSSDWVGDVIARSHSYDRVTVKLGGQCLIGNKFGGIDFWAT